MAKWAVFVGLGTLLCGLAGCESPTTQTQSGLLTFMQTPIATQGLIGSTPQILSAEFGQPSLLRVDGSAQVWLYHSSVCGLNLILYPDATGTPRVATAVPDNDDPARCMQSLQRNTTTADLDRPASS